MRADDETTATQLLELLWQHGISMSLTTAIRSRKILGWTFRGSHYCQLIREGNKVKWLEWCRENLHDDFANVIWTDETSVQLETHRRFCFKKKGERPTPKSRPKHPVKVHVWGGISKEGATGICIFTRIMNAEGVCDPLRECCCHFFN